MIYGLTNRHRNGHVWLRMVTMQACVPVLWKNDHIAHIKNQMEIIVLFYFVCLIKHVFLKEYHVNMNKHLDIVMKIDTLLRKDRVQNQIFDNG